MSTVICEHSIGNDPRYDSCVKCGREMNGRWIRDKERERKLIMRASRKPEYTESLVNFAQERAGDSQVRNLTSRSFIREIREEIADAANYLCWLDDQRVINGEDGLNAGELAALNHVTEAWRWLHIGGDS